MEAWETFPVTASASEKKTLQVYRIQSDTEKMEGANVGAEAPNNLFLFTAEYKNAATEERIRRCVAWLQENHGPAWRGSVQLQLESEQRLETVERRLHELSLASVRTHYPKLLDRTDSAPYWPTNHASAKVVEVPEFIGSCREVITQLTDTNDFWEAGLWAAKQERTINCDSEDRAQNHVVSVVESVLRALKLDNVVEAVTKRTLAGTECDVLLIYKPNRLPFSCIEVKKPGNTPGDRRKVFYGENSSSGENENLVAGELYDECRAVGLFGFENEDTGVVGMVATGNHWRLASTRRLTNTADDLIRSWEFLAQQSPESGGGEDAEEENVVTISPEQSEPIFVEQDGDENGGETDRILYTSNVVPALEETDDNVTQAGVQIVQLVVLYVVQACSTLAKLLEINEHPSSKICKRRKMPCRVLTNNESTFSFSTVSVERLQDQSFPPNGKQTRRIHVIHPIGSGEFGDCCLGVSEGGASVCAIKFFHKSSHRSAEGQAEDERRNWQYVYGQNEEIPACFTWVIAGQEACLVMPYLRPIASIDRRRLLDENTILKALKQFASTGYIHSDMKWRHFGWWKKKHSSCWILASSKNPVNQRLSTGSKNHSPPWRRKLLGRQHNNPAHQHNRGGSAKTQLVPSKMVKLETRMCGICFPVRSA